MNQVTPTNIKSARSKRNFVLFALVVLLPVIYCFFISSHPVTYGHVSSGKFLPYYGIFNLINIVFIYIFYYFDSIVVKLRRHWLQAGLIIFLPFIGVPIFLCRSRGFLKGLCYSVVFYVIIVGQFYIYSFVLNHSFGH